jgi:hypothetical protein
MEKYSRRQGFEEYRGVRDPWVVQELLDKAHNQVDLAIHYQIPYPRPQYVDPGTVGGDNDFRRQSKRDKTKLDRLDRRRISRQYKPQQST